MIKLTLILCKDQATSGLLTHDHFLQQHKKRLHIVFSPPGAVKTSFSRHICSAFTSNPQSSSHSLILLFRVRDKKVAEAKSLRDLFSCYSLPGGDSAYDKLAQLVEKNRDRACKSSLIYSLDKHQGLLRDSTLANRLDLTRSTYILLNLSLLCSIFSFNNRSLPDTLTQCYTILFAQLLQHQAKKGGLGIKIRHTLNGGIRIHVSHAELPMRISS